MISPIAQDFFEALQNGFCCLHPTDTLPGLTAWPQHKTFPHMIEYVKGARPNKQYLCLAAEVSDALKFWQPLPQAWESRLTKLWPGALTVVWQAKSDIPASLANEHETLAIRVPQLDARNQWLYEVMQLAGGLLPSTSVNATNMSPIQDWLLAVNFLRDYPQVFIPDITSIPEQNNEPSTIIEIQRDGQYKVLRLGAVTTETIDQSLC